MQVFFHFKTIEVLFHLKEKWRSCSIFLLVVEELKKNWGRLPFKKLMSFSIFRKFTLSSIFKKIEFVFKFKKLRSSSLFCRFGLEQGCLTKIRFLGCLELPRLNQVDQGCGNNLTSPLPPTAHAGVDFAPKNHTIIGFP